MGHFDRQEHLGVLYLSSRQISPGNLQIVEEQSTKVKEKMGHAKYLVCKKKLFERYFLYDYYLIGTLP